MGFSNWSSNTYASISVDYSKKSADKIFSSKAVKDMNPKNLGIRESRDSDLHPTSLAILIWLDVTGSMGKIPESIIKNELGILMDTIIVNGVEHPQILFGAIGDHISDDSPLQVSQFESGAEDLTKWLESIYVEQGGGGQSMESYLLAWLVGGRHTSIDCFEKRNQKGFLFTIGDEMSWDNVDSNKLKDILGYSQSDNITDVQVLEEAQRLYNVYHIHVNEGNYCDDPKVLGYWRKMLSERLIVLNDYHSISATIATLIAMQHGVDISTVVNRFDSKTAGNVTTALANITSMGIVNTPDEGIIRL